MKISSAELTPFVGVCVVVAVLLISPVVWTQEVDSSAEANQLGLALLERIAAGETSLPALIDHELGLAWVYGDACERDDRTFEVAVLKGEQLEDQLDAVLRRTTDNIARGLEDEGTAVCDTEQRWCRIRVVGECSPTLYLQFVVRDLGVRLAGVFVLDEDFRRSYPERCSLWIDQQWQAVSSTLGSIQGVPTPGVRALAPTVRCVAPSD